MPILIACRLICDAPTCHNRRPQDGFIDLSGEIVYDKNGGMEWSKSGDKLACSRECQQQLQEPSGGGPPWKRVAMFSADQLIAHAVGDYVLQSDWMANEKTKRSFAAFVHAATYTLAFLFFTHVWWALLLIGGTHFVIDRWRLAKYVCYAKNFLAPPRTIVHERQVTPGGQVIYVSKQTGTWWRPWTECAGTGYPSDRPVWLATWLLIITDNLMHVTINGLVLYAVN